MRGPQGCDGQRDLPTRFSSLWITGEKLASFLGSRLQPLFFIRKAENRSVSLRGGAALVSLQLA
jgi:hypothetical protein